MIMQSTYPLGTIAWNFEHLIMHFWVQGLQIKLVGLFPKQWTEDSICKKREKMETKGVWLQMLSEANVARESLVSTPI